MCRASLYLRRLVGEGSLTARVHISKQMKMS